MRANLTKSANKLFKDKNYSAALEAYNQCSALLGRKIFDANIKICEKNIARSIKSAEQKNINIAYITDKNFILPTYVSIYSAKQTKNRKSNYKIFVITSDVSTQDKEKIKSLEGDGLEITILQIENNYKEFEIKKNGFHVSTAAIIKFSLPLIIKDLEKLLYIDGDTIINSDLSSLFHTKISRDYAGVVEDLKPKLVYKPNILEKLSIKSHRGYFNSGMMLLNLSKMRTDKITEKLIEYRRSGVNFFMDQDALNVVFSDKVKFLPLKYNYLVTLQESFSINDINKGYKIIEPLSSFKQGIKDATIIHYASKLKPWKGIQTELTDIWNKHYLESEAYKIEFEENHEKNNCHPRNLIVSLTSYPARINTVHLTISSIINQSLKPEKIILWLAESQFPKLTEDLPEALLNLERDGLEIKWCEDIRSYKKLIPTLKIHPNNPIVTADDDIIYHTHWLAELAASYLSAPTAIHCTRGHKAILNPQKNGFEPYKNWPRNIKSITTSYDNFFTGVGGVLYPPGSLNHKVFDQNKFMEIYKHGDDIWFWVMALINNTKIKIVENSKFSLNFTPNSQDTALWKTNDTGGENDIMINNMTKEFPEIIDIILN